jgi:hypothetical protein
MLLVITSMSLVSSIAVSSSVASAVKEIGASPAASFGPRRMSSGPWKSRILFRMSETG